MKIWKSLFGATASEEKAKRNRRPSLLVAERNAQIRADRATMTVAELVQKYQLSRAYIYTLVCEVAGPREAKPRHPYPINLDIAARDIAITATYDSGVKNATELGEEYGITRERVCQILRRSNTISRVAERRRLAREEVQDTATELRQEARTEFLTKLNQAVELVRAGSSIRQASFAVGFAAHSNETNAIGRACKKAGIKIIHGKWRNFDERKDRLLELVSTGLTASAAITVMRREGDRISYMWAKDNCPDVFIRKELPQAKSENVVHLRTPRKSPTRVGPGNDWTPESTTRLIELWLAGSSAQQISDILGPAFTRNAVIGKVQRLRTNGELHLPTQENKQA